MGINQIKSMVLAGVTVYWSSDSYRVIVDDNHVFLIVCLINNTYVRLHSLDGNRLNGKESDFYT